MSNDLQEIAHRTKIESFNRDVSHKCVVFPDTNVFLHYPSLREIDWLTLAHAKSVELVVCMTVINELDKKKSDSRLSTRAERAIRDIREARNSIGYIRDGVTLSIFNREIRNADFSESLSPDNADDRIVHFAKIYLDEHPNASVAIATGDLGMELRADAGGISVIVMGQELRLENPQDELSKKYREAITELNSLKNRLPKLSVGTSLPEGTFSIPHTVSFNIEAASTIDSAAEMVSIRCRYPKYSKPNKSGPPDYQSVMSSLEIMRGTVDEEEWKEYNSKLERFYGQYEKHLDLVKKVKEIQGRSFSFDLWLSNDGSSLASDIDVQISFPENHHVFEKGSKQARLVKSLPKPPDPPEQPKPSRFLDIHRNLYDPLTRLEMIPRTPNIADILRNSRHDEWSPEVNVTDGQNSLIHIRLGKLKHGDNIRLGSFLVVLSTEVGIKSFGANYVVSSSDLPSKMEGNLPFRVSVSNSKPDQSSNQNAAP
jgi:rRNA-processing protein FCF1